MLSSKSENTRRDLSLWGLDDAQELEKIDWTKIFSDTEPYFVQGKLHRRVLYIRSEGSEIGFYIKVFYPVRMFQRLVCFYPYRAAREYFILKALAKQNIPAPLPVAYGSGTVDGCKGSHFLVLKEIPVRQTLTDHAALSGTDQSAKNDLIGSYGSLLALLNRRGWFIDDMHAGNVLAARQADQFRLWMIDHETTRPFAGYFPLWRKKNVSSALEDPRGPIASKSDRLHFVECYLTGLLGQKASGSEAEEFLDRVESQGRRTARQRDERSAKKPFKRAQRFGDLRVIRRRTEDARLLLERFKQLGEARLGGPLEKQNACGFSLDTHPAGDYRAMIFTAYTPLAKLAVFFNRGPAQAMLRNALREQSSDRLVAGLVEKRPFGPSAVFLSSERQETAVRPDND